MNTDFFAALASWFASRPDEHPPSSSDASEDVPLDCTALEDRVLYSAVPLNVDLEDVDDVDLDPEVAEDEYTIVAEINPLHQRAMEELQTQDNELLESFGDPSLDEDLELFFIDAGVEDIDALVQDLLQQSEDGRNLEIILLDADADGIRQISDSLALYDNLESIHIISHGNGDSVQLGASSLGSESISGYAAEIAQWSDALGSDADLLFYGCNLASTEDGRELLDSLSALCDCDVAASDDVTGHADLGGDWELEYHVGVIESELAFSVEVQQQWMSTLDITSNLVAHYEFEENGGVQRRSIQQPTITMAVGRMRQLGLPTTPLEPIRWILVSIVSAILMSTLRTIHRWTFPAISAWRSGTTVRSRLAAQIN